MGACQEHTELEKVPENVDTQLRASSAPRTLPPGRQLELVRAEIAETGDVGLVAENSRSTQRLMLPPPPLTAAGVIAKFRDIARLTGNAVSEQGPRPGAPTLCPSPWGPSALPVAWGAELPSPRSRLREPPLEILAPDQVPAVWQDQ